LFHTGKRNAKKQERLFRLVIKDSGEERRATPESRSQNLVVYAGVKHLEMSRALIGVE